MNTFIHQSMVDKRQRNYVEQTIKYKLSKQGQATHDKIKPRRLHTTQNVHEPN